MCMAYEPKKENWKQDLYFLKNCLQTRRFVYLDAMEREDENLVTSEDYVWSVTGENLGCLITERSKHFFRSFYQHFQEEYMLIYVLLLHRKYDLYKIITDFGIGEQNDLQTLKDYQKRLNLYQTDYAYERITEVPQYHYLYKKIETKMELSELFADVMEPVSQLSSMQMEKAEAEHAKREGRLERALALLSILTIFSALIDCWSYIDEVADDLWVLRQPLSAWPGQIIAHAVFSGVLILVALIVVGSLWLDFRKRK